MDPATDAAIALAIISVIEKLIADHNAVKAGKMSADELIARLAGISADWSAAEKADDAAMMAAIAARTIAP